MHLVEQIYLLSNLIDSTIEIDLNKRYGYLRPISCIIPKYCERSLFFPPTIPQEFENLILSIENTPSTGLDNISLKILNAGKDSFSAPLSYYKSIYAESFL